MVYGESSDDDEAEVARPSPGTPIVDLSDFDQVKENIQPLKQGRSALQLRKAIEESSGCLSTEDVQAIGQSQIRISLQHGLSTSTSYENHSRICCCFD